MFISCSFLAEVGIAVQVHGFSESSGFLCSAKQPETLFLPESLAAMQQGFLWVCVFVHPLSPRCCCSF